MTNFSGIIFSVLMLALTFIPYGNVFAYHVGDKVKLIVSDGCPACKEAEDVLRLHNIPFTTEQASWGSVPKLYVNDKYIGTGSNVVEDYVNN